MKILSLTAAAAAALSLALALGATGHAATMKTNPGPSSATPVTPGAIKFLACVVSQPAPNKPGTIQIGTVKITNTAGVALAAGTRIHLNTQLANGSWTSTSFILGKMLPAGGTVDYYAYGQVKSCRGQVNLLAPKEKVPVIPVPR